MKTINEQIEYMKSEVDWYRGKVDAGKGWDDSLENCEAILLTLENEKYDRQAKVG